MPEFKKSTEPAGYTEWVGLQTAAQKLLMQGLKEDIEIEEDITYSLASDSFSKPLRLTNKSPHIYVFKIKTNQRAVISMQVTHDFIKPNSVKDIIIKLAEKPSDSTPLRLELNYVIPTEEEIRINDSKMNSYGKDAVFRRIITISRNDAAKPALASSAHHPTRKEENVAIEPSTLTVSANLSSASLKEEKKEERREEREEKKEQNRKEEVKVESRFDKPSPQVTHSPIQYPNLSYIRQVESEQIDLSGKSAEIDITGLIEAPSSSQEAITTYSKVIDIAAEVAKSEAKPLISLPLEKEDSFYLAPTSPAKKAQSIEKKTKSEEEKTLTELNEKLEKEQGVINKLRNEQTAKLSSDCVYPVPIVYLLVVAAFLVGNLVNWIAV